MNEREELMKKIVACSTVMEKIKSYEDGITGLQEKKKKVKGVGAFIIMFILFMLLASLLSVLYEIPLIGGVIVIVSLFIPFVCPFVLRAIIAKKLDEEIAEYETLLAETKTNELLEWLPLTYRDYTSYSYISSYIQNMRANNLQEALNLFETEIHRAKLEYIAATSSK